MTLPLPLLEQQRATGDGRPSPPPRFPWNRPTLALRHMPRASSWLTEPPPFSSSIPTRNPLCCCSFPGSGLPGFRRDLRLQRAASMAWLHSCSSSTCMLAGSSALAWRDSSLCLSRLHKPLQLAADLSATSRNQGRRAAPRRGLLLGPFRTILSSCIPGSAQRRGPFFFPLPHLGLFFCPRDSLASRRRGS
jgi:hypothetical protein